MEGSTEGSTIKSIGSTSTSLATDEKTRRTNKSRATGKSRKTKTPTGYSRSSAVSSAESAYNESEVQGILKNSIASLVSGTTGDTAGLLEKLSAHEENLNRIQQSLEHNVTARNELIAIYESHQAEDEKSLTKLNKQIKALQAIKGRVSTLRKIQGGSVAGSSISRASGRSSAMSSTMASQQSSRTGISTVNS